MMEEQKQPLSDEETGAEEQSEAAVLQAQEPADSQAVERNDQLEEKEDEDAGEQQSNEPALEKEFTLNYRISPDDLYEFHLEMGRDQVVKNGKRTKIMGWIEVAFGGAYLISLLISGAAMPVQYLLSLLLMGMGVYGITFYKTRFYKNLRKATDRQHNKTPYFQNDIVVDFYPNKCTEHVGGDGTKGKDTFWREIDGVRETKRSYIIDLGQKRCLLLPKEGLGEQAAHVDAFFTRVCENYEKPRTSV